jgi:plastocyanin
MTPRSRRIAAITGVLAMAACGGSGDGRNGGPSAPQFGSVSGTVTEGGAGVAGASLQLSRAGATTRNATTAAGGAYQFAEVATGTWTVALTAPAGYQVAGAAAAQVTVNAGQSVTANFALTRTEPPTGPVEVVASDNSFTSADVTISVNGTIRWRNAGTVEHNSTSATALWSSGNLAPGATFEHQFRQAGVFNYSCTLHPGMAGVIRVQ